MTPRETFKSQGLLTKCSNPLHTFEFKKFIGEWQWGEECWSSLSDSGTLTIDFVSLAQLRNVNGFRMYQLLLGKFRLSWAFLRQ